MTTAMSDAQPQGAPSSAQPGAGAGDTQPSSGVAPSAPAPWSESQQAAHAEMQALRGSLLNPDGTTDLAARSRYNELSAHVYSNGPLPQHMRPAPSAQDLQAPATDANGFKPGELAHALYQPAERPDDIHFANLSPEANPQAVGAWKDALHGLGLSASDARMVFEEAQRMAGMEVGEDFESTLEGILKSSWGTDYELHKAAALRAWDRLPKALREDVEQNLPALTYSPWLWHALSRAERYREATGNP